jgi:hypothetical protein
MFFFTRKKRLVVDCFTYNKAAYEVFKIDYAKKFIPDWWKKLPVALPRENHPTDMTQTTMKGCPGFIDYYRTGIIIPLWTDALIEVGPIGSTFLRVAFADQTTDAKQHPEEQRGDFLPDKEYCQIKFDSPWLFKTKEQINWIMMKPFWNYKNPTEFIAATGCLNFHYQHSTNINIFIPRKPQTNIINLTAGIPMAHIIPQTDRKIELRHHLLDKYQYEIKANQSYRFGFINSYNRFVGLKKQMRD